MLTLLFALNGFALGDAQAQTFDAHGPNLPPDGASLRDPLFGSAGGYTGAPVVTALTQAASGLLVDRISDGPTLTDVPIVDSALGLELGLAAGITGPVGIGVSAPVWFLSAGEAAGGFAFGDTSVWVPIRLISTNVRLGLIPFGTLPTGADARYLGEPGFSGGGLVSGGYTFGPMLANLDLGLDATRQTNVPEWPGGVYARYAFDLGWVPNDAFGFHAELRSRIPLNSEAPSLPTEAMGTLKVRPQERLWVTSGLGTAITRGVGAPGLRFLIGVSTVPGKKPVDDEILVRSAPKEVHIVDQRMVPLTGVTITVGNVTVQTDLEGYADIPARAVTRSPVIVVEQLGFDTLTIDVSPEDEWWEFKMQRIPVPLLVSVVGPKGVLDLVDVYVDGPYEPDAPVIDEAGVFNWQLRPGVWRVRMSSPGLGDQERTIVIEQDRADAIRVDAVLASQVNEDTAVRVTVVDRLGRPVEDAVIALGDRDLGTTGTGGDLVVYGLDDGETKLVVRSERFGDDETLTLVVGTDGEQSVQAVLDWQPGSVQVVTEDSNGFPVDATVTFLGPANLPPRDVGADGEQVFVLRPGKWDVRIEAPGLGTQVRRVQITDSSDELVTVNIGLLPQEEGSAEIEIQVVDVDGSPLPGVTVLMDGKRAGWTGPDGTLSLLGLHPGFRTFTFSADQMTPIEDELTLVPGRQVETTSMAWVDGVTDIIVTGPDTNPFDALVTFEGPGKLKPAQVGLDGAGRVILDVGEWKLTTTAEGMTDQSRTVIIPAGSKRLNAVKFQLDTLVPEKEVGEITITVVDAKGEVVENAEVLLGGKEIGQAVDGILSAEGVATGTADVSVFAEGMDAAIVEVDVDAGETEVQVQMTWAPGAIEVQVEDDAGELVEATVTLRGPEETLSPRTTVEGSAVIGASPGQWFVVVESDGMKTQEIPVDLSEETELTEVAVVMTPLAEDEPSILLNVQTPDGEVLANAEVTVDGVVVGRTSGAGTIEIMEFDDSDVIVTITPETGYDPIDVQLDRPSTRVQGEEQRLTVVAEYASQAVEVQVVDAQGNTVSAEIIAIGSTTPSEPVKVDDNGKAALDLKPGSYTLTARTEDGSLAIAEVVVKPQSTRMPQQPGTWSLETSVVEMVVERIQAVIVEDKLTPIEPLLFDFGRNNLRENIRPMVADLARWMLVHQDAALIEIAGHTDDIGGVSMNQALSEQRARTVESLLIEYGVAPERLMSRGYGLSRPITAKTDDISRARNRRVELVVLEWASGQ